MDPSVGVCFLSGDEAPEFASHVLNSLRQPLESGTVTIGRTDRMLTFPARFQLVLAANPCPCGRAVGKGLGCTCTVNQRRGYLGRLAGPLLDRIDLQLSVPAVSRLELVEADPEPTAVVAARVAQARAVAAERYAGERWSLNGEVPPGRLRRGPLRPSRRATQLLDRTLDRGGVTLRGYDRVTRVAWTLADLAGHASPTKDDIDQALTLRGAAEVAA
ncbi:MULTISPECIES: ATP-binding protein [Arsenicicoccus]|uniref:ATP-binding protein n=1 Tax=Arsenicicoccus TaxID=267408 RepID=UPI0004922B94|nr:MULTISPECIES: ATP-binding protein [Arsenicicoccus]